MEPPGMTDEVFVENRCLQQHNQLCMICQVILTMGGVKMAEAPPTSTQTGQEVGHELFIKLIKILSTTLSPGPLSWE